MDIDTDIDWLRNHFEKQPGSLHKFREFEKKIQESTGNVRE